MALTPVVVGEWVMASLATIFVAARMFVRLQLNKDRLHWADSWLLVGLFCAVGLVLCDTMADLDGELDNYEDPSVRTLKFRFATNYFFDTGMYFPKFSIIAFYWTLVPVTQPHMRVALYVLTAVTAVFCVATFFDATFWCGADVSSNWSTDEDACRAFDSMTMMRIHWALNFSTEVLSMDAPLILTLLNRITSNIPSDLVFPFPLVRDLKLPKLREKIGLCVILGLGVVTIAVSIGRFITMVSAGNSVSSYLWTASEISVALTVVALTALRPLLRKIAQLVSGTTSDSDQRYYGTYGASTTVRTRTGKSKPTHTQGSGVYWRTHSVTGNNAVDDNESDEVELRPIKPNQIMQTREVTISSEAAP
ncbi:unnamed protein product [Clonostachys chloroleuca]|uniref:Rhodopsin domain-containing protein n=1 Tax=Clonostachys chloroleuca TaxID=1926264 RepID=A0AA35LQ90_9HYPO|nr:unnamed protein product [Clonostachys chloroleuca]